MDLQLRGKKALVTGSTAGIGYAIAAAFAAEGATVIINGRSEKRVNVALENILQITPQASLLPAAYDLSQDDGMQQLIADYPSVDILINNLGMYEVKNFFDITDEEWLTIFNVNVLSGIRLSRHYLKAMLKKNWGRIIFISSESGINIPIEMIHYGMTKTAQLAIARGLAEMTAGTEVTVNSILPGPTFTEGVQDFIKNIAKEKQMSIEEIQKEFFKTVRPSSLLQRFLAPEEIANLVLFLASPFAAGTNGAATRVEGGLLRSII